MRRLRGDAATSSSGGSTGSSARGLRSVGVEARRERDMVPAPSSAEGPAKSDGSPPTERPDALERSEDDRDAGASTSSEPELSESAESSSSYPGANLGDDDMLVGHFYKRYKRYFRAMSSRVSQREKNSMLNTVFKSQSGSKNSSDFEEHHSQSDQDVPAAREKISGGATRYSASTRSGSAPESHTGQGQMQETFAGKVGSNSSRSGSSKSVKDNSSDHKDEDKDDVCDKVDRSRRSPRRKCKKGGSFLWIFIVLFIIIIIAVAAYWAYSRRGRGGSGGARGGAGIIFAVVIIILLLILFGGFFLSKRRN